MKKNFYFFIITLLCCFSVYASSENEVVVNNSADLKVVSLAPNITETIYGLDMGKCLVGRTDYCNYPSECLSVDSIGEMLTPNVEKIISLKPDAVIASSIAPEQALNIIEKSGIKTYRLLYEDTLEGTYSLIEKTSQILGCTEKGQSVISEIKRKINDVKKRTECMADVSCIYIVGWGDEGLYAATGDTYINDIILAAGGVNCASEASCWTISRELLLLKNPDYIIIPAYEWTNKEETESAFRKDPFFGRLKGKIVFVNADVIERQGVRTAEAVCTLAGILHPSLEELAKLSLEKMNLNF